MCSSKLLSLFFPFPLTNLENWSSTLFLAPFMNVMWPDLLLVVCILGLRSSRSATRSKRRELSRETSPSGTCLWLCLSPFNQLTNGNLCPEGGVATPDVTPRPVFPWSPVGSSIPSVILSLGDAARFTRRRDTVDVWLMTKLKGAPAAEIVHCSAKSSLMLWLLCADFIPAILPFFRKKDFLLEWPVSLLFSPDASPAIISPESLENPALTSPSIACLLSLLIKSSAKSFSAESNNALNMTRRKTPPWQSLT